MTASGQMTRRGQGTAAHKTGRPSLNQTKEDGQDRQHQQNVNEPRHGVGCGEQPRNEQTAMIQSICDKLLNSC